MEDIKIKNLTPHEVVLVNEMKEEIKRFSSEGSVRLSSYTEKNGMLGDIPLTKTSFGSSEGLPDKVKGTYLIVSSLVCQASPYRDDLLMVNETIRDDDGKIVGCKSLTLNPFYRRGK